MIVELPSPLLPSASARLAASEVPIIDETSAKEPPGSPSWVARSDPLVPITAARLDWDPFTVGEPILAWRVEPLEVPLSNCASELRSACIVAPGDETIRLRAVARSVLTVEPGVVRMALCIALVRAVTLPLPPSVLLNDDTLL